MLFRILFLCGAALAIAACGDDAPTVPPSSTSSGRCGPGCPRASLAGRAFVELLKADFWQPELPLDALLRDIHALLCDGRPGYVPEVGATAEQWVSEEYPMGALDLAEDARCGSFMVDSDYLPGPRALHESRRVQENARRDHGAELAKEHLGAAILYLLRLDAKRFAADIEALFDLMCGPKASSQHLQDVRVFTPRELPQYAFATCEGFSHGDSSQP
jgi:hypothetical protein